MELKTIADLLYKEKYEDALTIVNNLKGISRTYGGLIEIYLLISKGDLNVALEKTNKLIDDRKERYNWDSFSLLVEKSIILFLQGNINDSRSVIDEGTKILNLSIEKTPSEYHLWLAEYFYLKAEMFFIKTYFETAVSYCGKAIELALEFDDNLLLFKYYELSIKSSRWLFEFESALNSCERYFELCQKLEDSKRLIIFYGYLAEIFTNLGKPKDANLQLEKYIKISSDLNYNLGIFNYYIKKCEVSILYGEIKIAQEFITKAIEFANYSHLENVDLICSYMSGRIYLELDLLTDALEHFKAALKYSLYDPFNFHIQLLTLYYLIYTNIESGDIESAKNYYEETSIINQKTKSNFSSFVFTFCKALIFRQNPRINVKFEAQSLLKSILDLQMDVILKIQVLINLCELSLDELRLYGQGMVLNEIEEYLKVIQSLKDNLKSSPIQVELIRLQAKLAIIEGKYNQAFDLLNTIQPILKTRNMNLSLRKIDQEIKTLKKQFSEWNILIDNNEDLKKQIESIDFQEFVKFTEEYITAPFQEDQEKGLLFLIVNSSGLSIFSKYFQEGETIEDQLIAGLLSAINAFSQDTFKTNQPLERIKQGENTLIIKSIANFYICYAFKGISYFANKKINDLFLKIQENENIINELVANQNFLSDDIRQDLSKLVDQCFN